MEEKSTHIAVVESFKQRQILITGSTGFVGKVLLSLMLYQLPQINRIYVLIRKNDTQSALDRFVQTILSSFAFKPLHEKLRENFNEFITSKVKVLEGDIAQSHLGIPATLANYLYENLDLIINVAGLTDFFPDIKNGISNNVDGVLHIANFTRNCKKAVLAHISTCFVAGNKSGVIEETVQIDRSPTGKYFNAETEYTFLSEKISEIIQSIVDDESRQKELIQLGRQRALSYGWPNTYCFTKALAEILLTLRYPDLVTTIIRPSVVESAIDFPLRGWNEGITTSSPLVYIVRSWYPYCVAKEEVILDVIPIDLLCNSIIKISAALLNKKASKVYQLGTSDINPLTMSDTIRFARKWHRQDLKRHGANWFNRNLQALLPVKTISKAHFMSPESLINKINFICKFENWLPNPLKQNLNLLKKSSYRINKIYKLFSPFIYDNLYIFKSLNVKQLVANESEFQYDLKNINWEHYWFDIHVPGLNRWIFPLFRNEKVAASAISISLTSHEKLALIANESNITFDE